MSWLNLNQSLNSLKGQITNFASEVLSENVGEDARPESSITDPAVTELQEKCRSQEHEIASLKKLTEELQASLQSERLTKKNGLREEESSWYWDPVPQTSKVDEDVEKQYKTQIQRLQDELAAVRDRDVVDLRPDTDEELNRLRDENKNLTANLEDLDNQHQMAMDRLLTLKKELQKNFEVLKQEHEELKSANDEYANEVKVLLAKIGERDNEIERIKSIKSDFDTLLHKYQNLERIHSLLRENAEKFQEENQELHEEVFKLQEQVTKLEHDVEIVTKHSEVSDTVPKTKYEEVLKELHDLKGGRNSNEVYLDEINIDDNAKSVIEALKRDINELRHKLSQRESDINDNNDNKIVKSERIMQLYNKYVNFDLPVDYVGEMPSATDNLALYKLECAFKTLNSFKKEVDTLEHKLSEKTLNVNHLQTQIDDLTTENDYLTSDVQHFERELSEMKKNNDFLISEIAALKNTSKLEPIIETHEDNLAKLETELADSNNKNKTFESEIKRIEAELAEVNKEKKVLQEGMSDMKKKYKAILDELETYRAESRIVEQLELQTTMIQSEKIRKEIDDLKKRLNSISSKNEQLCIDVHILENDKVLLTNQVDELKNALEAKISAYRELEFINDSLEDKIVDLKNKLEEIGKSKQEVEADKFVLEKKLKDLEDEVLSKTDFEKVVTEKSQIADKLDQTQKQNSELLQTVDQLSKEVDAFKLKEQEWINSNESITQHSDEKVSQLEISNSELQKIKAENESLTSTNLQIEKLVSEKNELLNKFDQTLKQNSELSQKVEQLTKEIETFKLKEQEWIGGNKTEKLAQFDIINSEFQKIKAENERLEERNLHLEAELFSTDGKISNLEEKFEKLLTDLEEKDSIIDKLNATISENTPNTATFNHIADLENAVEVKTQALDYLGQSLTGYTEMLRTVTESSNEGQEELRRLREEKEQVSRHVKSLEDEVTFKTTEISRLTNRLEELEKCCLEFNGAIEVKNKEMQELNKLLLEATNKAKALENKTEVSNATKEKSALETTDLRNTLEAKEAEISETKSKLEQLERACEEYKTTLENATIEKNDLIKLITLKHNESIQYHNEIQRLNQVILEQTSEFKRIIEEKEKQLTDSNHCLNCVKLSTALKEKDEIIMVLNQNISDYERLKVDLHNNSETVRILTTKCEDLDRRLTMEVETVKKLTAENAQLSEQEQNSSRELERLRHHLVELEENYTQELMTSEQKLSECQVRLHQVEERAKQTSTVYTSNSIRANQEVETLRNQIKLLEKQREEVQTRLSDAEDARSRSEAALTNLQVVLEQFQLDKERDIHNATEKIRNKMEEIKRENDGLRSELAKLNSKLEESIAGLQAATRLGDQVETKTAQINDLKEQVRTLQTSVAAAEERYYNAISNQQDKVDKNLVKNLVINYVTTAGQSNINRVQVLRVLSTVLDFNQKECERLGLARSATAADSLAAEFVKFLQNESKPRAQLPDMNTLQAGGRASVASSRKSSTVGPPVFDLGHRRNPSTGSNNLLFQNLEAVDTASQKSTESDARMVPVRMSPAMGVGVGMDTGVNQTRNNEGAILKHVLKDM